MVTTTFTAAVAPAMATLAIETTNPAAAPRGCTFHVALGDGGANRVLVEVDTYANGGTQTVQLAQPAFTVSTIDLDPDHECLVFPASAARIDPDARAHPWLSQGSAK